MAIDNIDPTTFNTSVLIADALSGGYPATMTEVGGDPVAAALEIQSDDGALLLPRLTTTQMNAMTPVVDGMIIYNTTAAAVYERAGNAWVPIGSAGSGTVTSISQGANIVATPNPITTTGTIAVNPVLTGLTSAVIGNISLSTSANTISASSVLNITSSGNMTLTPTASLLILNADTQIKSGLALQIFNAANSFRNSFSSTGLLANVNYILPTNAPSINGQVLSSTTTGTMSWVSQNTGTVTSITAGSNLTGGTITGSGTISLSNAVSGLTSLAVGTLTMSGSTVAGSGSLTIQSLAAMDLSPSQLRLNSEVQVRSANTLRLFNTGNTFSTSLTAPALIANINYTLPLTAPTNGQVLSSTAAGVMSWVTAGSGSVTSISQGANIVCTPNPIVGTGTVALSTTLTGLTSAAIGNITISGDTISDSTTNLTLNSVGLIILSGTGVVSNTSLSIGANSGIQLFNSANTFSTSIIPGNVSVNTSYTLPSAYPASNGYVLSSTTTGTMSWVAQSGGVTTSKYLLQQADGSLPNAQAMGALATGIVKNTTTTGVQSIAVAGTDYYSPGNPTTILDTGSSGNLFLGTLAGTPSPTGTGNVVFGLSNLDNISTGLRNTSLGAFSGAGITSQQDNTLIGYQVLGNAGAASLSVFIGNLAANSVSGTCIQNTFVGYRAGSALNSATQVTLIGCSAAAADGLTNATALGYAATITASNAINLGNGCNVGINTTSPAYALHISPPVSNAHVYIANSNSAPATPTGGGVLYVSAGALLYVGSSGTTTIIAPA